MADRLRRTDPDEALRLVGEGYSLRRALAEAGYAPSTSNSSHSKDFKSDRELFLARRRALMIRVLRRYNKDQPQPLRFT